MGHTEPWGEELGGGPLWDTPNHGVKSFGGGPLWHTPNHGVKSLVEVHCGTHRTMG